MPGTEGDPPRRNGEDFRRAADKAIDELRTDAKQTQHDVGYIKGRMDANTAAIASIDRKMTRGHEVIAEKMNRNQAKLIRELDTVRSGVQNDEKAKDRKHRTATTLIGGLIAAVSATISAFLTSVMRS
jgi:hypothetical protein